ncbi:S-adenosyl-L-methionine-dependent methyltransferase [Annulohypoxylon moriforme]|nr:S-adenosyl-L-methionine-dependent methyltransferase [Annulohypoxylon moriforme]
MNPSNTFVPKQAITKDLDLYAEIVANSTQDIARAILDILPPIQPGCKIHDNGCGAGEVTSCIMERDPPPSIHIEGTDIDEPYLDRFRARATEKGWPVNIANMCGGSLTFPDNTFDLSISNFMIFITPEGGMPALRHVYRTLKTPGTAVFTAWSRLPHVDPVYAAHKLTRGPNRPALREIPPEWWLGSHLVKVAEDAGFASGKIELRPKTVYITIKDVHRLATVMWSYLGVPLQGWSRADEERWDEAIEVILKSFHEVSGFEVLESGELKIELTANILIAHK